MLHANDVMIKLQAVIEKAECNYSAYIEELDGVVATGSSIDELKKNLIEAIGIYADSCVEMGFPVSLDLVKGSYEITFKTDIESFLNLYCTVFSKSGLEKLTGVNQKQLWHYANGKTTPRAEQVQRIESALHRLGEELISLQF